MKTPLTPPDYRDIAEYLAIAQADLLATSETAKRRNATAALPSLLMKHASRAGKLRAMILHALITQEN
mgnify:CR=1 FL=1